MSKETYIGGDLIEEIGGSYSIYGGEGLEFQSNKQIIYNAKDGITYEEPESPSENKSNKDFPKAFWSKDYQGTISLEYDKLDKTGYRAELEDTVYFQVQVNKEIPIGTKIDFQLFDYDTALSIDWLNPDDSEFGEDEEEVKIISKVREIKDGEYNRITLKLYLNPEWNKQKEEDKGAFRDGCLDLYWNWTYNGTDWAMVDKLILRVYYSRNLYINHLIPSKYELPEIIDSESGDSILFLFESSKKLGGVILNEGGDVVNDIKCDLKHFYMIRIKTTSEFNFTKNSNKILRRIYEEQYNIDTGRSITTQIDETVEFAEFTVRTGGQQIYTDSEILTESAKKLSDYFNVRDIKKIGFKTLQSGFEILGYLDYYNGLSDAIAGRKMPTYDTIGIATGAVGIVEKVAPKLAKSVAGGIALPQWINPVMFSYTLLEAFVIEPFLQDIQKQMDDFYITEMEKAKRKGLGAVRQIFDLYPNMKEYYKLVEYISQETHNKVFVGKIKTFEELRRLQGDGDKKYTYLIRLTDKNEPETNFIIETIFI